MLGRGSGKFQVSSLRFFMCTPCLNGLKDSPERFKKIIIIMIHEKNIHPAGHSLNLNVRPDLAVCNAGSDAVV